MDDSKEQFIVGTTGLEFLTLSMAGALNVKIVRATDPQITLVKFSGSRWVKNIAILWNTERLLRLDLEINDETMELVTEVEIQLPPHVSLEIDCPRFVSVDVARDVEIKAIKFNNIGGNLIVVNHGKIFLIKGSIRADMALVSVYGVICNLTDLYVQGKCSLKVAKIVSAESSITAKQGFELIADMAKIDRLAVRTEGRSEVTLRSGYLSAYYLNGRIVDRIKQS